MTKWSIAVASIALVSCGPPNITAQNQFMDNLRAHCGQSYAGKLVSTNEADKDMAAQPMVMEVRSCTDSEIRIPFHVGDDHSRTWIITKTDTGLRLKHRHNHEDGSADAVTYYGGDTNDMGTENTQTFPVDEFSKIMFVANGLDVSVTNVWTVSITKDTYAYELRRKNRHFRVEFDLSQPVAAPPAPW